MHCVTQPTQGCLQGSFHNDLNYYCLCRTDSLHCVAWLPSRDPHLLTNHACTHPTRFSVCACVHTRGKRRERESKNKKKQTSASFILTYTDILYIYHNSSFVKISFLETMNGYLRSYVKDPRETTRMSENCHGELPTPLIYLLSSLYFFTN